MNDRNIEFIVDGFVTGESGRFSVVGRCGDEPIHVGDTFRCLFRYKSGSYPKDAEMPSSREEKQCPVELRIEGIHAYEQDLAELGPGMTGSIALRGQGVQLVSPGSVLGMPCPKCNA